MILFHTTKYGEGSLILHGYSEDKGRSSYILRGVAKKNKSSKISGLHPLCLLKLDIMDGDRSRSSLKVIKDFSADPILHSIRSDIYKSSISMFISELLYRSLTEDIADAVLYNFIKESIVNLERLDSCYANYHLYFLVQLSGILGFRPTTGFEGEYDPFTEAEIDILNTMTNLGLAECMALPLRGDRRLEFVRSMIKYFEFHLGVRLNIKSLDVLSQILN